MGYQEPPEAQSIRSMLHIARILALIFGILFFLAGLAYAAYIFYAASVCSTLIGDAYCGAIGFLLIWPILLIIWGVFDVIIYMRLKAIETQVNNRQYEAAKSQTLLWMILGFIIGGIIVGIILVIAYIKFDPLINAQRAQMGGGQMPPPGAPPMYAPPPQMAPAPMAAPAAPPPPAAGGQAAPFCGTCGKPTTYIPQYGRYYCYDCKQYV